MDYSELLSKIERFIKKYYLNQLVRGSMWVCFIFLISFLVIVIAEYYGYFSPTLKTILFYCFIIIQALLGYFLILKPLFAYLKLGERISYEQASQIIGSHFPEVSDKLTNTVQLQKALEENPQHGNLMLAAIRQKIDQMQPVPFVKAIKIRENKKYLPYVLFPIGVVLLLAFTAPSILTDGTNRILHHDKYFAKKAPFQFHILNKPLAATQGEDFLLKLKLSGDKIPQDIFIDDGVNTYKLKKEDILNFNHQFKNLQKNKNFRFKAGEFYSDYYTIHVSKKPLLLHIDAKLEYPKYIHKKAETITNPGNLTVPEGTRIQWNFRTENASAFEFSISAGKKMLQPFRNNEFSAVSVLKESTEYALKPINHNNGQETLTHFINVIPDAYPQISAEERPDSLNSKVLYFIGTASDDYGISKLSFNYEIRESEDKTRKGKKYSVPIKVNYGEKQNSFFYFWPIHTLGIKDGEEVNYYFEVKDNDGVNGSKTSKTAEKTYKLPSKTESYQNVNETTSAVKQKIQSAIRQSQNLQKEAQKLNQELLSSKNLDFEQQKQIEQLLDKQQKLEQLLKEISEENQKNLLERKQLDFDQEVLEKQQQIQELFDNVLDEQTKELLKNLQKLMDEKNGNLPPNEMKQLNADNKSLQKELDRILELYKKLEAEQKLNENIKKLEELADKQLENSKENNLQKQESINNAFKDIKEGLKDAKDKNEALDRPDNYDIKEQEQKNIENELDKATQNLKQNKKRDASQAQKNAAEQMKDLAQKLNDMQQNSEMEQMDIDQRALRQILQNLLKSSFDQEKLMLDMKKTDPANPKFNALGQKQREIKENLKIVEDSLFSLSKKVPQIASTVNKEITTINEQLAEAINNLPDRNIAQANKNQQYALTSINNLSLMLSEALQQLQNAMKNAKSGGKGKPQPGMSELSKMQEELNKNMQKAKEQMQQQGTPQGQKGKGNMSQQFSEMARQQQLIRQALQELNQKMNKDGQGKLGNLEKIMKEMEQTETELVNKRITQESLLRQQEIQIKLLEAEKAEREREQDSQRESRAGKEFAPNYDKVLKEYQKVKAKETELLKTIPPSLNNFYKLKINDYLDNLK